MWLPTPIYERIPQFWFLLGLLFIATGLYLGFDWALSFWYIAVGFACCAYGVGVFLVRLRHRQSPQPAEQAAAAPAESAQAESLHSDPAHAE
jgi:Ca2+/Na+ antiporter